MSGVKCHVSGVMCLVSDNKKNIYIYWTKWWGLWMEGLLSTRPTPSSLFIVMAFLDYSIMTRLKCMLVKFNLHHFTEYETHKQEIPDRANSIYI